MHQKPQVHRGKCIKKGHILADGAATVGGELALDKNVLVAYMPYEGYNSEDVVLISERLVYVDTKSPSHGFYLSSSLSLSTLLETFIDPPSPNPSLTSQTTTHHTPQFNLLNSIHSHSPQSERVLPMH
ncbi:unnamed protein product [Sphenostylis stenocarpa]|uniref:DNA-directed RNA polymerase n=1 Tax=Sphenostylis stenocarpa TaxID=92480 RepID=A0AA86STG6_9FABA|nr:unnamed protein product [Sphenostylis stenocarpa]